MIEDYKLQWRLIKTKTRPTLCGHYLDDSDRDHSYLVTWDESLDGYRFRSWHYLDTPDETRFGSTLKSFASTYMANAICACEEHLHEFLNPKKETPRDMTVLEEVLSDASANIHIGLEELENAHENGIDDRKVLEKINQARSKIQEGINIINEIQPPETETPPSDTASPTSFYEFMEQINSHLEEHLTKPPKTPSPPWENPLM